MYGLSKNVDLSFLSGVELQQVCIGRNEVILNFDQDVRITVLSSLAVSCERGTPPTRYDDVVIGGSMVLPLLHDAVSEAEATDEGGLLLAFASGGTIIVFDDSDQYESFWIAHGKEQIIA